MADVQNGGPGEKEQSKPDSPKPDQEVAPPLISKDTKGKLNILTVFILLYFFFLFLKTYI